MENKADYYKKTNTGGEYGSGDLVKISKEEAAAISKELGKNYKKKKLKKKLMEYKESKDKSDH